MLTLRNYQELEKQSEANKIRNKDNFLKLKTPF